MFKGFYFFFFEVVFVEEFLVVFFSWEFIFFDFFVVVFEGELNYVG